MAITTASDSLVATAADPIKFLLAWRNGLDLNALRRRLEVKFPRFDIDLLEREYRRFLAFKFAHRDEHAKLLSPSPMIDQV
ncbi:hypothetical protein BCR44DRAFT_261365 [Catenaria anguillulae PL171]|uniref:Uncharacterized protein n=1 Tax=Catenaria anguillulae PL171 TaxID=765915 RepID=A0A1Y2H8S5_9FUNG|nr:hypothetical protein BCR44DRAFT_261365 [Catenaria anguillulae PL171]